MPSSSMWSVSRASKGAGSARVAAVSLNLVTPEKVGPSSVRREPRHVRRDNHIESFLTKMSDPKPHRHGCENPTSLVKTHCRFTNDLVAGRATDLDFPASSQRFVGSFSSPMRLIQARNFCRDIGVLK